MTDASGAVKARRDYLSFGEEIGVVVGGEQSVAGYTSQDKTRQRFTSKERDTESQLDYFLARYYSSSHGRFTSQDEPFAGQDAEDPQTWNLYAYSSNDPLNRYDPDGHRWFYKKDEKGRVTDLQWVNPNEDGTYTSPGEGYTEFIPGQGYSKYLRTNNADQSVVYLFTESEDGSPVAFARSAGGVTDATMDLVAAFIPARLGIKGILTGASALWAKHLAKKAVGEAAKSASERLANLAGKTKTQAQQALKREGFEHKGITPKGYEKWYHPDGSRIQIRPNGEVVRTGPKTTPAGGGKTYRPRVSPDGKPTTSHNTGEKLSGY